MTDAQLVERMMAECQSLSILYVEDDLLLAENTAQMLAPFFKSILIKHDGLSGLEAFKNDTFDIVLTDLMMPKMDGCEMSKAMRKLNDEQSIIVMSAHEETHYFLELIEIGISKFIPKPPKLAQLFTSILSTAISINNAKKVAQINAAIKNDLAESKELLRNIIDTVPVRIFWKSLDSAYMGANKLFAQDAGYEDQDAIIGRYDRELIWAEHAQGFVNDDLLVMSSGVDKLHFEEMITRPDHSLAWISTSKRPLRDVNGDVIGVLGCYIDITEQKNTLLAMQEAQSSLYYQAHHDALTGLANRTAYLDQLHRAISKAREAKQVVAVVFIDIDRFKEINDTFGHEVGDEVVVLMSHRLKQALPSSVVISRFGGDEFMLFIEMANEDKVFLSQIITGLLNLNHLPFLVNGHSLHITLSMGISMYPNDGDSAEILIRNADTAMYQAKNAGRDTYQFYDREMTEKTMSNLRIANNLRVALEKRELTVYYQPQVDARSNQLVGMEALVRWHTPTEGFISPAVFIPVAEDAGLIDKLGRFVFEEAVAQLVNWYASGLNPGKIAINVSPIELQKTDFVDILVEKLQQFGVVTLFRTRIS